MPLHGLNLVCPMSPRSLPAIAILLVISLLAGTASAAAAASVPSRRQMLTLFRGHRTDLAALSPDGRRVAYVVYSGSMVHLILLELDSPGRKKTIVPGAWNAGAEKRARKAVAQQVTYLKWLDDGSLVYVAAFVDPKEGTHAEVRRTSADGTEDRMLLGRDDASYLYSPPLTLPAASRGGASAGGDADGDGGTATDGGDSPSQPEPVEITRDLRVHGEIAAPAGGLIVEAVANEFAPTTLFHVPLSGAKPRWVSAPNASGRFLFDRQMEPRILETPRLSGSVETARTIPRRVQPQVFRYRARGQRGWQDLDALLESGSSARYFRHYDIDYFGPRSFPLVFDAEGETLYFASNAGRDTFGLYALDLQRKQLTDFAVESPLVDLADPTMALTEGPLVFDRDGELAGVRWREGHGTTRWFDAGLAKLQTALEREFTSRRVELLEWDAARSVALALVSSAGDPGRYFVFQDGMPSRIIELVRRVPELPAEALQRVEPFAFDTPAGVRLTGTVAMPRVARVKQPPLILVCRDIPGRTDPGRFDRELQALAAFGFVVAQVNYRGVDGFGARHRDAARDGFDRVPLEDLRTALQWLLERYHVDPRRVALVGEGFGGFLAIRGLQLHPTLFRCAVAVNPALDLDDWQRTAEIIMVRQEDAAIIARQAFFTIKGADLAPLAVLRHQELPSRPVLLAEEASNARGSHVAKLRERMQRQKLPVEYAELPAGFARGNPDAMARAYLRIGEFLNEHIYEFGVKLGEVQEVK